jgi:hypothetical protein
VLELQEIFSFNQLQDRGKEVPIWSRSKLVVSGLCLGAFAPAVELLLRGYAYGWRTR